MAGVFVVVAAFVEARDLAVVAVSLAHALSPSAHVYGLEDPARPHCPRHEPPIPQQLTLPVFCPPSRMTPHRAHIGCVATTVVDAIVAVVGDAVLVVTSTPVVDTVLDAVAVTDVLSLITLRTNPN